MDNKNNTSDDNDASKDDVAVKKIEISDNNEVQESSVSVDTAEDTAVDKTPEITLSDESKKVKITVISDSDSNTDPEDVEPKDQNNDDETKTIGEALDSLAAETAVEEQKSDVFLPDPDIDAVVDDIVRSESNESIAIADEKMSALHAAKDKKTFKQKIKKICIAWWENRPLRYGTFAGLFLIMTTMILLPVSRYSILNALGVRVETSMKIVDSSTRLPLKDITVSLQDQVLVTDKSGEITFQDVRLGESELLIQKRGYADTSKTIVLGWGSNPIGEQQLVATGEQFTFILKDWLDGEKVLNAEATTGENSAVSDDDGKIILTVGEDSIANVTVSVSAEGYRTEILGSDKLNNEAIEVSLVPSQKNIFVSNRNGKFDIYKVDVDGNNEELLFEATEKEREVPGIMQHPTKNVAAIVSSRDGFTNTDGYVLDGLFIVDTDSGESNRIARSEQIQVLGWSGDTIVFWQVVEGTSRGNAERSKLLAYNSATGDTVELAAANYFNSVALVNDVVTYAVSSFAVPQSQAKLYQTNVDGKNNKKILDSQVYNIFRPAYDRLLFSAFDQMWYEQTDNGDVISTDSVAAPENLFFFNAPNGEQTAWVEVRDGKGVLLLSSTENQQEEIVLSLAGLDSIHNWVNNDTLVFQVIKSGETANYVVNVNKPEDFRKIKDVTASKRFFY